MADHNIGELTDGSVTETEVLTVSELNSHIAAAISDIGIEQEYIRGDVADQRTVNGNIHFDLVHDDASIHCLVMEWQRSLPSNEPDEGQHVAVSGDISYYEEQGSCTVFVDDAIRLGDGTYSQKYEAYRDKLAKEGLLAADQKTPLPDLPSRIGLVTSAESDARTDAVTALHSRYPDLDIVVKGTTVQGEQALEELMDNLHALDRDAEIDVIVITRGGGADATLRVFNEPPLCRAVAATSTPVVAGIGHENDHTLVGEVADQRVMTPTHAGDIVPDKRELREDVDELATRLADSYSAAVSRKLETKARALRRTYRQTVSARLQTMEQELTAAARMQLAAQLSQYEQRLDHGLEQATQRVRHERALETATEEATAKVQSTRRRYRIALVLLLLIAGVLILFIITQL